jgi:AcrR family transcriptional regulator
MTEPAVDHRRATAVRNATAILDATERLLARHAPLTMAAIATEAGISRPTLYAHHKTLAEVLEAAVARAVHASLAAVDAAEPEVGPAAEALERTLAASWAHLGGLDVLARGAAEHLPGEHLRRAHAPLMARTQRLVRRGQREGAFRTDLPAGWLVTTSYALMRAANDHTRTHRVGRARALAMLTTTVRDLFAAR